jgi:hypothetical protein
VLPVVVLILHAPADGAGPLAAVLASVRLALADHHARGFRAAGAADVRIIAEADDRPFGARLRSAASTLPPGAGIVVLGSGALPLAGARDRRAFVHAAGAERSAGASARGAATDAVTQAAALTNNRWSSDAIAVPDARSALAGLPDLAGDNALPRWLAERGGVRVTDLRHRRALQADLDGLADLALLVRSARCPAALRAAAARHASLLADLGGRVAAVEAVAADPRAEIVVAGRLSAAGLEHLESATACRVRALVEERGLRAADPRAQAELAAGTSTAAAPPTGSAADATPGAKTPQRPPASVLGMVLDREGPRALGGVLARLGDAAIVDTRVLLAHRLGADERAWPPLEDRLASDLGLASQVRDPWLRALTESAAAAPIPVLLGAHSLVGPGLDLLFRGARP